MHDTVDVAIVGGGLAGAGLALALARAPALAELRIALLEAHPPAPPSDAWDSRVYAISPGSAAFLRALGVWDAVDAARVSPVYAMRIVGDEPAAQLNFTAYEAGLPELAHIVESGRLQHALWQALHDHEQVHVLCPAACEALSFAVDQAELKLANGDVLRARLVVGADGAQSWVRKQAGIVAHTRPYGHSGVVANFETTRAHEGVAWQWFRPDGVLALLPMAGNRVSMVWSTADEHARELLALDAATLADRVVEASDGVLGALRVVTPAVAFPLLAQKVEPFVKPRLALIGDAAHNVHPLAGQGVNLGLRDARELGAVLADRGAQRDCGDYGLLRRYERARKEDVLSMGLATDGLQKLFAHGGVWVARTRNLGLRMVESQRIIKRLLIKHAVA